MADDQFTGNDARLTSKINPVRNAYALIEDRHSNTNPSETAMPVVKMIRQRHITSRQKP